MKTQIARWGHSLAVRLPKPFADEINLQDGNDVDISLYDGRIVVEPLKRRYKLDELLAGITSKNRHKEVDWGAPAGNEIW